MDCLSESPSPLPRVPSSPFKTSTTALLSHTLATLFHQPLRQRLKNTQQFRVVRRSQTRHWVPSAHGGKARCPTPLVAPKGDVVERRRIGVDGRIDESDRLLARIDALLIDEGDDGAERRGGGGGTIDYCRASGE